MTRGGARNRSGPQADPNSLRSASRGLSLTALPREGYSQEPPAFLLPPMRISRWEFEDKRKFQVFDAEATEAFADRELALWESVWRYPQACAWAAEPWRWYTVAMWVRTAVVCEGDEATAADKNSLHRFADQIGLTPAGLKENGWGVAKDEVSGRRQEASPEAPRQSGSRARLRAVAGDER